MANVSEFKIGINGTAYVELDTAATETRDLTTVFGADRNSGFVNDYTSSALTSSGFGTVGGQLQTVIVGDSFAAQEWTVTSSQSTHNASGLFTTLNGWLGSPWNIVADLGVAGYTSTQWLPQVTSALAYNPRVIAIFCGYTNDIATGVTAATIISNLSSAYATAARMNCKVIHATNTSATLAGYFDTYAKRAELQAVYEWLTTTAEKMFPNLLVIDAYSSYTDPSNGQPAASATSDNLHPNDYGVNLILPSAFAKLSTAGFVRLAGFGNYEDYRNLLVTPLQKGAGLGGGTGSGYFGNGTGGINGGSVTSGWLASNEYQGAGVNGTWSVVARTDGPRGSWSRVNAASGVSNVGLVQFLKYGASGNTTWAATTAKSVGDAVVPTVANGFIYFAVASSGSTSSTQPTWPTKAGQTVVDGAVTWVAQALAYPGDKVRMRIELRFPNAASQKGNYTLKLATGGVAFTVGSAWNQATAGHNNLPTGTVIFETPDLVMPLGAVNEFSAKVLISANGGTALDIDVGRCLIYVKSRASGSTYSL